MGKECAMCKMPLKNRLKIQFHTECPQSYPQHLWIINKNFLNSELFGIVAYPRPKYGALKT